LANILKKQNQSTQKNTQLNKPEQLNTLNTSKQESVNIQLDGER